jgi:hypothetical protein
MQETISQIMFGCIVLLWLAWMITRYYESGEAQKLGRELHKLWKDLGIPGRTVMITFTVMCTLYGGSKAPGPTGSLYRMLFWHGNDIWALTGAATANELAAASIVAATNSIVIATNTAAQVDSFIDTNDVVTFSFDWHSPNRLPYHDRQNVLGRTVWVAPTNIAGVAYEDHYVAFNELATTNPAVILIEYARKRDDGTVERYSSPTITNSYPLMVPVSLQSGVHTCYWFRCAVPVAYTNGCCVRDWNGEALFGSPTGSGKGFDLLGTLLIDDGDNIWEGATTNMVVGAKTNAVKNGVILE